MFTHTLQRAQGVPHRARLDCDDCSGYCLRDVKDSRIDDLTEPPTRGVDSICEALKVYGRTEVPYELEGATVLFEKGSGV